MPQDKKTQDLNVVPELLLYYDTKTWYLVYESYGHFWQLIVQGKNACVDKTFISG